jgi:DNA polymerase-3 subunit alpha
MNEFVHLNVHTEYSIVDGIIQIDDYLDHAKELGFKSVAITDKSNLFAYSKFFNKSISKGIKPLIGVDFDFNPTLSSQSIENKCQLTFMAMNNNGLKQLFSIVTEVCKSSSNGKTILLQSQLSPSKCEDLICIQHCNAMDLVSQEQLVSDVSTIFIGRHYIGISRLDSRNDFFLDQTFDLASRHKLPVVPSNKVCFLKKEEFEAHEARLCIQHGYTLSQQDRIKYSEEQYLKSADEMLSLFSGNKVLINNTVELAKRCNVSLDSNDFKFPVFPIEKSFENTEHFLAFEAKRGLKKRFDETNSNHIGEAYKKRLDIELKVISEMGFAGYFLVVADFITWSKENSIPVGPGRGSGAGSLVAYALGIVDLDPIKYDLLFERFLNPERISMPDFDIDFCIEGRDQVIEYVSKKYGKDNVSQIITFGTMAAKAVIRDVGRVLGLSYGYVDRIAKLIPFEIGITIDKALIDSAELSELYETNIDVQNLIELAKQLEGLVRNAGTHAGGVVIAPEKLTSYMPLYFQDGNSLTQLDKDDLENLGLVKFDFLGLKTLTVIQNTLNEVEKNTQIKVNINKLDLKDSKTYNLLCTGDTVAVFQLESSGMRDLIKKIKPDNIEDLIALIALFRPGPLQSGMVEDFISRKQSRSIQSNDYFHESLKAILEPTYGVILYQEQVMQIAQVFAGYSLGGADILRRAMGKKKAKEMREQKQVFIDGAVGLGQSANKAEEIFDIIEKFAGYGFNKSHSAAYGLIAYQTAYLKANHRSYFLAATMTFEMDNTDKITLLINDCRKQGIEILAPDVNSSFYNFSALDDHSVMYGLGAIKGIGKNIVSQIIYEREQNGEYLNIFNFCERLVDIKLSRRTMEALIKSGSLNGLGNQSSVFSSIELALSFANSADYSKKSGQTSLFDSYSEEKSENIPNLSKCIPWSDRLRLRKEYESLGLYLTGHPFNAYRIFCEKLSIMSISDVLLNHQHKKQRRDNQKKCLAGIVLGFRKRGSRMTLNLDDGTDIIEVLMFDETAQKYKEVIQKGQVIVVEGSVRFDEFINAVRVSAEKIYDIDEIIANNAKRLTITIKQIQDIAREISKIKSIFTQQEKGACEIAIEYYKDNAKANIALGDNWKIKPTLQFREQLIEYYGNENFKFHFGSGIMDTKLAKSSEI